MKVKQQCTAICKVKVVLGQRAALAWPLLFLVCSLPCGRSFRLAGARDIMTKRQEQTCNSKLQCCEQVQVMLQPPLPRHDKDKCIYYIFCVVAQFGSTSSGASDRKPLKRSRVEREGKTCSIGSQFMFETLAPARRSVMCLRFSALALRASSRRDGLYFQDHLVL